MAHAHPDLTDELLAPIRADLHAERRARSAALANGVAREERVVAEQFLADITAAIARIEQGQFGICDACSTPIEMMRLEALPTTRFCIGCAADPPARPPAGVP